MGELGKGTMKGYIAIFICMATRAVHIEVVEDYTSEVFIAAFHRFTARRGFCKELFSDQGTNFVGADTLLKQMVSSSYSCSTQIVNTLAQEGTSWIFNPPSAPHFGGIWEAAVKSAKHHMRRVIGEKVLTFSELATFMCRINVINVNVPPGKRWLLISHLAQHCWRRWSTNYLTSLQPRQKWRQQHLPVDVGDLVLIRSELTPPAKWSIARITAIHPGSDGITRVVDLRTVTTTLRRPIAKVVRLHPAE